MVKFDNLFKCDLDDNLQYETIALKKATDDSWSKFAPNWERIKAYLTDDDFTKLINIVSDVLGYDPGSHNCCDVFSDTAKHKNNEKLKNLISYLKESKNTPIAMLLAGDTYSGKPPNLGENSRLSFYQKTMVGKGIGEISRIDGELLIPVCANDLNRFRNGSGVASLFDGGLVTITDVISLEYTDLDIVASGYCEVLV